MPLRSAQAAEWRCTYYGNQSSCGWWYPDPQIWGVLPDYPSNRDLARQEQESINQMERYEQRLRDDEERELRMKLMRKQLPQLD
jgi:hypothetical protein